MLKRLLLVVVLLLAGVVGVSFTLPERWKVERQAQLPAPPEAIYPFLARPRAWQDWSAWRKDRDPDATWSNQGPEEGTGASQSWQGPRIGSGTLRITWADPRSGIGYALTTGKERIEADGEIRLSGSADRTVVTWVERGSLGKNPLRRYLRPTLERMVGQDLELGLAGLTAAVARVPDTAVDAGSAPADEGDAGIEVSELADPPDAGAPAPKAVPAQPVKRTRGR